MILYIEVKVLHVYLFDALTLISVEILRFLWTILSIVFAAHFDTIFDTIRRSHGIFFAQNLILPVFSLFFTVSVRFGSVPLGS